MSIWGKVAHFRPVEWGKDPEKAAPDLILAMDAVREMAGVPIHIHVCWDAAGHSERSYHYTGQAVDFHFATGLTWAQEFAALSAQSAFGAIGWYPGWAPRPGWHVDLRSWSSGRLYWRRERGEYIYGIRAFEPIT